MESSDQKVLAALKEGSQAAFEMLFKTYYRPLCAYAFSFLQDKDEAEEIVQSTFITFWDRRHSIEIESSLKAYLYRMVRNGCLNALRHTKVKQLHATEQIHSAEVSYESVSQSVVAGELDERIQAALQALPEQCRLVFQLSRFEDLKYQEIASQLNISVKTVENHMGKALRIMRTQLREYLPALIFLLAKYAD